MRQIVDIDGAQDQAALGQESIGRTRLLGTFEMQQEKIPDARRNRNADVGNFLFQPGQPLLIMRNRLVEVLDILQRRDAGF